MQRMVLGLVFGTDRRKPFLEQTIEQVGTGLAHFHDCYKIFALTQLQVETDKFERFDRHGVMVATIATGGPALDGLILLRQYRLQVEIVGPVVFTRKGQYVRQFLF